MAMSRRRGGRSVTSRSPIMIRPPSGNSSPAIRRSDYPTARLPYHAPPHVEEVAAHEEDEDQRREDQREAAGEAEVERRVVERAEDLCRQRAVAQRQDRRGEDLVPGEDEGEDRRRGDPRQRQR